MSIIGISRNTIQQTAWEISLWDYSRSTPSLNLNDPLSVSWTWQPTDISRGYFGYFRCLSRGLLSGKVFLLYCRFNFPPLPTFIAAKEFKCIKIYDTTIYQLIFLQKTYASAKRRRFMNERLRRGDKYADPPRWLKLMEWIWLKQFIIAGSTVSASISFKIEFPRSRRGAWSEQDW